MNFPWQSIAEETQCAKNDVDAHGVTAYNAGTPLGVSTQTAITIEPYRLFLPLTLKN